MYETINPCNCGGLPFTYTYYAPTDLYMSDPWAAVQCMRCGEVIIEFEEHVALMVWNSSHDYKINEEYMITRIFAALQDQQLKKELGVGYESENRF